MEHTTPLPILARLIAKFQDEAENFSCGVGAGGYKSEDNPFGQDPATEAYLQNEIKILTTEWQERTGEAWSEADRTVANFQLNVMRLPCNQQHRHSYLYPEQDYSDWEVNNQEDLDQDYYGGMDDWEDAGFYEE